MMLKKYAGLCALLLLCSPLISLSQDLDSLLNLSAFTAESELQKALNKGTTVSSSKALTLRETPGIISVMSAEEIQNTGARDLTDLLRLIPGFDIAQDLQFVQGISLRGNWSNEGKVFAASRVYLRIAIYKNMKSRFVNIIEVRTCFRDFCKRPRHHVERRY